MNNFKKKEEMNIRKQIMLFSLTFFMVQVAIVISQSFYVVYMESQGFSMSVIGRGSAIMAGGGILGQFVISYVCDKKKKLKKYFCFVMIFLTIAVCFLYQCKTGIIYILFFTAMVGIGTNTIVGLIDSWSLKVGKEVKDNYGLMRAAGSLALFISAIILGKLVTVKGYYILQIAIILVSILTMLNIRCLPDIKVEVKQNIDLSCLKELVSNKKYIFLIGIHFCVFCMVSAELLLLGSKLNFLGGASAVGMFFGIQALSEIPSMILYKKIRKIISEKNILIIAALLFAVREILFAMANTTLQMFLVSWTDAVTYAPIYVGAKYLFDEVLPEHLKITGQMMGMAIYCGGAGILAPIFFGMITQHVSFNNSLFILSFFGIVSCFFAVIYKSKCKRKGNQI